MIIYNPHNVPLLKERIKVAESLLGAVRAKYCFMTGSFLYKKNFNDIDIFVITRSKKKLYLEHTKANVTILDFNDLYSLFYHSVSKSCIANTILPLRPLKVTLADYWDVINEAVPTLLNEKDKYHKHIRSLVLYTEFFRTAEVFDTFQLDKAINSFRDYNAVLSYISEFVPQIITEKRTKSYLKRFFYTQSGHYKEHRDYAAQNFLYNLSHSITQGLIDG